MPSPAQTEFFNRLTDERDFGDSDIKNLRKQFSNLNDASASTWIERALKLPKTKQSQETVEPPF